MKHNLCDVIIVLDRSGSMQSIRSDTIGGVNQFIEDQKKVPGDCRLTLVQFDDRYEPMLAAVPIREAKPLDQHTYVPRGNTALFGAVGRTIDESGARFANLAESERPEKVIFVIVTDGLENHSHVGEWSRNYTRDMVKALIDQQQNIWKWQFVFIGAQQDAILSAADIGIAASNAINYTNNPIGTTALYASVSSNVRSFRSGQSANMAWSEEDRKKQDKAKSSK